LPPDSVVDSEDFILEDSQRLIEKYHDPSRGSMVQIVLAPCSPFSVTGELMRESAHLARQYGVHLHTHLAETRMKSSSPLKNMDCVRWGIWNPGMGGAGCLVCPFCLYQ
jgi:cytosine/adenosine deaminase-related metal-dependent hydrolase